MKGWQYSIKQAFLQLQLERVAYNTVLSSPSFSMAQSTAVGPPLCCTTLQAMCNWLADHRHTKWSQDMSEARRSANSSCTINVGMTGAVPKDHEMLAKKVSQSSCLAHDTRSVWILAEWLLSNSAATSWTLESGVSEIAFQAFIKQKLPQMEFMTPTDTQGLKG